LIGIRKRGLQSAAYVIKIAERERDILEWHTNRLAPKGRGQRGQGQHTPSEADRGVEHTIKCRPLPSLVPMGGPKCRGKAGESHWVVALAAIQGLARMHSVRTTKVRVRVLFLEKGVESSEGGRRA